VTPAFGNASERAHAEAAAAPYSASRRVAMSLRAVSLVVFVVSMLLSACGRQVTGLPKPGSSASPTSGVQPGFMSLRFRVNAPLDFTDVAYVIVFNTSGNGVEPYANQYVTGFSNYSFAWIVGGTGPTASTQLIQYYVNLTTSSIQTQPVVVPQNLVQLSIGTSGTPNEFTLQFARVLFNQPNPTQTSSPNPAPTLTPGQLSWNINFFTVNANPANGTVGAPIDANGTTGITDTSFVLSVNTTQVVSATSGVTNDPYVKPAGSTQVSNQAAAINQDEVDNNP
jgi:hypothetical protein